MVNSSVTQQRTVVDRVVLVSEQGVKQDVVTAYAVNVAQCQMLVLECVVVRGLQLVEEVCGGDCRA